MKRIRAIDEACEVKEFVGVGARNGSAGGRNLWSGRWKKGEICRAEYSFCEKFKKNRKKLKKGAKTVYKRKKY